MRFPLRRVLLGFGAGAAAGWAVGLLRSPSSPPPGSSAGAAVELPQEDFGEPVNDPEQVAEIAQEPTAPPRKATAPAVKPVPGAAELHAEPEAEAGAGESEPATGPEVGADQVQPEKRRPARRRTPATDPVAGATEALREGHAAATERLSGAESAANTPSERRRRRPAQD